MNDPGTAAGGQAWWIALHERLAQLAAGLERAREATVGCSARSAVWRQDKMTLYRYAPLTDSASAAARPLLVCFALVNRPYVLDLQPDRSLIRALLAAGRAVYVIDWGDPDEGDRRLGLEDYIGRYLGGCVQQLRKSHGVEAIDLLGVCQGGTFSLCYAALNPAHIATLITLTAPVDFQTPGDLLSRWVRAVDMRTLERTGNMPGALLNATFVALKPFQLLQGKYVNLLRRAPDAAALEDFVRMEKWIADSPDQAARALSEFVQWFYQENRLIRGTLELGGKPVRLERISQPLLNIYATRDHIVPAAASAALSGATASREYSVRTIEGGHIGIYVSRTLSAAVAGEIIAWLRAHP
jgi:polyhydroxyalkanoate synthase subunit PhaC